MYNSIYANQLSDYMEEYKSSGRSRYKVEQQILEKYSYKKLTGKLMPFYMDSVVVVRQKAYYLAYKKGMASEARIQQKAVLQLLGGCNDSNGGTVGQLFSYLLEFPPESYNQEAKDRIDNLLLKKRAVHFKKNVMLAGMVGTGQEIMQKKFIDPKTNNEIKWILALALARQGHPKYIDYCMERIKDVPVNNNLVAYMIPDLIYTRQREAINYCIDIINSDKKDCNSLNPDRQEPILCAYRIMELLAPVIVYFPFKTDATGNLVTDNYGEALIKTREWFSNNTTYQIRP